MTNEVALEIVCCQAPRLWLSYFGLRIIQEITGNNCPDPSRNSRCEPLRKRNYEIHKKKYQFSEIQPWVLYRMGSRQFDSPPDSGYLRDPVSHNRMLMLAGSSEVCMFYIRSMLLARSKSPSLCRSLRLRGLTPSCLSNLNFPHCCPWMQNGPASPMSKRAEPPAEGSTLGAPSLLLPE